MLPSQPLFILGAPRSGTTFLCCTLNRHPHIRLTNESRIFMLLKDLIDERSLRPDLLESGCRDDFRRFARSRAGGWAEQFYREALGIREPIWGDKHTSYGDPVALSGRTGAMPNAPRSGSCLRLIRDALPRAKFIHIHRHPWQVAASMKQRGWVRSMDDGVQVWRQHVSEIDAFFDELDRASHLTLSLGDMIEQPDAVAAETGGFLHLADAEPIARFLREQREAPTPFSSPTSDLRQPWDARLPERSGEQMLAHAGDMAARLGYAAKDPKPSARPD